MQKWGKECLSVAKEMGKWVVLDADGLWAVTNEPEIIKGYDSCFIWCLTVSESKLIVPAYSQTPNIMEFKRLCEKLVRFSLSLFPLRIRS
jgi:ATP-dependent NAD(P)H-hydrate dehydratase